MAKKIYFQKQVENANSWDDLMRIYEDRHLRLSMRKWIFRGQGADWELKSLLQRECEGLIGRKEEFTKIRTIEKGLLRVFQRRCHQFLSDVPKEDSILEWYALMQHYGAPTRLLDWTYSYFNALYSAVEKCEIKRNHSKGECVLWALDQDWTYQQLKTILPEAEGFLKTDQNLRERDNLSKIFYSNKRFLCPINPYRLNKRIILQQGVFLCPGDITKSYVDNIIGMQSCEPECASRFLIKIIIRINRQQKQTILQRLHRMNISRTTLFSGLEGFAQSLKTLIYFHEIVKPALDD